MTTPPAPTRIGTILKPGDPIPPDATGILDRESDPWARTKVGHWHGNTRKIRACDGGRCREDGIDAMIFFSPLTVVATSGDLGEPPARQAPRVWPQLGERIPADELPAVVDVFGCGRWWLNPGTGMYRQEFRTGSDPHPHTFNELRLLGNVREVLS